MCIYYFSYMLLNIHLPITIASKNNKLGEKTGGDKQILAFFVTNLITTLVLFRRKKAGWLVRLVVSQLVGFFPHLYECLHDPHSDPHVKHTVVGGVGFGGITGGFGRCGIGLLTLAKHP